MLVLPSEFGGTPLKLLFQLCKQDPKTSLSSKELLAEQHRIFIKYINTTNIDAYLGRMGNNLDRLEDHFYTYPNVVSVIGAMLAEQRTQPKRAHQFFCYQDRILFGKDVYKSSEYYAYFRLV